MNTTATLGFAGLTVIVGATIQHVISPSDGELASAVAAGVDVDRGPLAEPPEPPSVTDELVGVARDHAVRELSSGAGGLVANQLGGPVGQMLGAGVSRAFSALGAGGGGGGLLGSIAFGMAETVALDQLEQSAIGRQLAFGYRAFSTVRGMIDLAKTCTRSLIQCGSGLPVVVSSIGGLARDFPTAFPPPPPPETWSFADEVLTPFDPDDLDPTAAALLGIELPDELSGFEGSDLTGGGTEDDQLFAGRPDPGNPFSYLGPDLLNMGAYDDMPRQVPRGGARILVKGTQTTLGVENTREAGVQIGLWLMGTGRADMIDALDLANSNVSPEFVEGLEQAQRSMAIADTMNNVQQVMDFLGAMAPLAQAARGRFGRGGSQVTMRDIIRARASLTAGISRTACFAAGTTVATPRGPVPIETLQVGDLVLARDPATGEVAARPIDAVFVRPDQPVLELDLARAGRTDTLVVTAGHPFFVRGRGWVDSERLVVGDEVITVDGAVAVVEDRRDRGEVTTVHNLEVRGFHTYFVGSLAVWVHNETRCDLVARFRERYRMGGTVDQAAIDAFKQANPRNHITVNQQLRDGQTVHAFQENSRFDNGTAGTDPKGLPRPVDGLPQGTRILAQDGYIGDTSKYTLARNLGHTEFSAIREIWERYQVSRLYPDLDLVRPGDVFKITSTNRDSKLVLPPCRSCQQAMRDAARLMPDIKIEYRWTDSAGQVHVWTPASRTLDYNATVQNGKVPVYVDPPR